jgi:oxygen-independent coproporphyrinogen-3 oxidase
MISTNTPLLQPDLEEVERLFPEIQKQITHYFSYSNGVYFNAISLEGQFFDFENKYNPADDLDFKRFARRYAKLALYQVLSEMTGKKLPWGALTGIRPTKLAYGEKELGRDPRKLFDEMGVMPENIDLVMRVLEGQKGVYSDQGGQDLFVSIPFCPTKCAYCSFITAPIASTEKYLNDYLGALEKEIESVGPLLTNLKSVYIGGGTPFVLKEEQLKRVLSALSHVLPEKVEYTVEAGRPDVFTEEKLELCQEYGVTRMCVNAQSFTDETLVAIGRKHTAADVLKAYEMARKYSFDINCDLIAGLTGESVEQFRHSVMQAVALECDNITVHTLCLKAGAKLKEKQKGQLSGDGIAEMMSISREILTANGYEPYYLYRQKYQAGGGENVGWTKKGKACIYNIDTMEELSDNIAVGAGSVSKRLFLAEGESRTGNTRIERYGAPKDIKTYLEKVDKIIFDRLNFYQK